MNDTIEARQLRRAITRYGGWGVSHGTLRNEDLVPRFLEVLRQLDTEEYKTITELYSDILTETDDLVEDAPIEESMWLLEALFDSLDAAAPSGYRFGAYEGDGAEFGFWEVEDM